MNLYSKSGIKLSYKNTYIFENYSTYNQMIIKRSVSFADMTPWLFKGKGKIAALRKITKTAGSLTLSNFRK